ncbi:peptidase inhibitor family I36 protein [Actinomadura sp. 6N118]|uniref:peptidase inhibitor family I36 protein n=1 Tax=Actinomadura sp. 6N118 TaxID=3375151 RepID=UPI0037909378
MARLRTIGAVAAIAAATAAGSVAAGAPAQAAKKNCKIGYFCAWSNTSGNRFAGKADCRWWGDGWNWSGKCGEPRRRATAIYNHGKKGAGASHVRIYDKAGGKGSSACIKRGSAWDLTFKVKDPEVGGYVYVYKWTSGPKKGRPILHGGIDSHKWVRSC